MERFVEKMKFKEFIYPKDSIDDFQVAHLYLHTQQPVKTIAKNTNRSIAEIYRIIRKFGNEPNRQITNHDNVHMFADSGMHPSHIATLTGYTPRNVRYILEKRKNW